MGGVMSLTGMPDGPPLRTEAGLGDTGAGLHCAIGILAALVQRQQTGEGQRVEVAQQDSVLNLVRIHLREHYVTGTPVPRRGNRSVAAGPSTLYRCRPFGPNDYVFVHCATLDMWRTLPRIPGRPDLGDDPRLADRQKRAEHAAEIDPLIEAWTEKRTKHEAMEALAGAGIPCGAVLDSREGPSDPGLGERGMVVSLEHPMRGRFALARNPVQPSAPPPTRTPPPPLGQHNAEVYGGWLGLPTDELRALEKDRVI